MPRRYRSRRYRSKRKYSVESGLLPLPTGTTPQNVGNLLVVASNTVAGMRKAKNFLVQFSSSVTDADSLIIAWALVYVPYQTNPNSIQFVNQPHYLYEPSQFVIMGGLYDSNNPGNTARQFSRLSRNLNEGDTIQLVWRSNLAISPAAIRCLVRYAICFS